MKASFAALLVVLLCVERASSLMCFHCDSQDSNAKCLNIKTCPPDADKYCTTRYFGGGTADNHKQSISKDCAASCPQGGLDLGLVAFSMKCCTSSLCNISGAMSVKSSSLVVAAGVLASFLYLFGAKL